MNLVIPLLSVTCGKLINVTVFCAVFIGKNLYNNEHVAIKLVSRDGVVTESRMLLKQPFVN